MKPLTVAEIRARVAALPKWTFEGNALRREFVYRDFAAAFAFMTRVATLAEAHDHHPDGRNVYNRVTIALSTHDAGGVTHRDFELAAAIDAIAAL